MAEGEQRKPKSGTARELVAERVGGMDFDFPITAHCEICGWEWREGRSTGKTKWNTLRNYCQRHATGDDAAKAHDGVAFDRSGSVKDSWLSAKRAFEAGD